MGRVNDKLMDVISKESMIDEWRERIHNKFAPCSNEKFLIEYTKLDPSFESLLWDEYDVDLDDLKEILKADEEREDGKIMDRNVKVATEILEVFDDLLEKKGVTIHCDDPTEESERNNDRNSAKVYGMEAAGLIDSIASILDVEYMEMDAEHISNILYNMSLSDKEISAFEGKCDSLYKVEEQVAEIMKKDNILSLILLDIAKKNKEMYNKFVTR